MSGEDSNSSNNHDMAFIMEMMRSMNNDMKADMGSLREDLSASMSHLREDLNSSISQSSEQLHMRMGHSRIRSILGLILELTHEQ